MKMLLATLGWALTVAGLGLFIAAVVDGVDKTENGPVVGPAATFVLAGAVFVLASLFAGHRPPVPTTAPMPPRHPGPPGPPFPGQSR
ncbi:hypothetical protein BLA60_29490 [Actinophytocola xinjiangensis]|uniref:Uncharacterized protein n=1 Tax=Actinophytocola xinjiangensis TaxID=485602 RepID=A0A7Z1AWI7_9PSEU|nr:hypothetical protein [Actinophytocola xinjiangensis]OLF06991.1 hypothetical protein BLA60_29490 [Actinophytocola xinjiangensis]